MVWLPNSGGDCRRDTGVADAIPSLPCSFLRERAVGQNLNWQLIKTYYPGLRIAETGFHYIKEAPVRIIPDNKLRTVGGAQNLEAHLLVKPALPHPDEFAVYSRRTSYSTDKAERVLGYASRFSLTDALPLTAAWLRHHGYVVNAKNDSASGKEQST